MIYAVSDIHGCYSQYEEILEKIAFSDEDTLYVLGDVLDRGPEPLRVLEDMAGRHNVIYGFIYIEESYGRNNRRQL